MTDGSTALSEESPDPIQIAHKGFPKEPKAKHLRDRRSGTVKHRICAADLDPLSGTICGQLATRFDEPCATYRFGTLEPTGQFDICKDH